MLETNLLFQDHMVLQRDKEILIWGSTDQCEELSVAIQGNTYKTLPTDDGMWQVKIGPLYTSFNESVLIKCGTDCCEIQDVQVGDVWLAGGQSNMEFYMHYDADLETEKDFTNRNIRFFDYPEVAYLGTN